MICITLFQNCFLVKFLTESLNVLPLERDCTKYQKSIEAQMNEASEGDVQPIQVDEGEQQISTLFAIVPTYCNFCIVIIVILSAFVYGTSSRKLIRGIIPVLCRVGCSMQLC